MKRKIVLILTAIIILSMPFQQTYMETEAAIVSKAASKTAQKIAKTYIDDIAINTAIKVAADGAKKLNDSSLKNKPGYMVFCMDYTYKPGDKCKKPANIKADLTATDKANIKKQTGKELDKLISPGGKGFSKWAKFLDWFIPIWLVTLAVTTLTYALDPDVQSLFDEAAYNSLVALGIISPVSDTTVIEPLPDITTRITDDGTTAEFDGVTINAHRDTWNMGPTATVKYGPSMSLPSGYKFNDKGLINVDITGASTATFTEWWIATSGNSRLGGFGTTSLNAGNSSYYAEANVAVKKNGDTIIYNQPSSGVTANIPDESILQKKIKSVQYRAPYKIGDFYYTDILFNTVTGDYYEFQARSSISPDRNIGSQIKTEWEVQANEKYSINLSYYPDIEPYKKILVSPFEESELTPTDDSSYKDEKGNIALLPPAAFTYEEEATGDQVERKPAPNGDGFVWQKPNGTIVPEDNVIPKPEEEPNITPAPNGTPQYTPAPTPSNPTPQPEPLVPNPNAPPVDPPGTGESEPPLEPLPEGSKCDAKLKFPIFSPLKETLQTSFPFSIPWDIERAALAIFGGISNEKPNFKIAIPFLGETHEVHLTIPKFMDEWKPFMDSFLLITFDLLLMFGLYRFVKGAGS